MNKRIAICVSFLLFIANGAAHAGTWGPVQTYKSVLPLYKDDTEVHVLAFPGGSVGDSENCDDSARAIMLRASSGITHPNAVSDSLYEKNFAMLLTAVASGAKFSLYFDGCYATPGNPTSYPVLVYVQVHSP